MKILEIIGIGTSIVLWVLFVTFCLARFEQANRRVNSFVEELAKKYYLYLLPLILTLIALVSLVVSPFYLRSFS